MFVHTLKVKLPITTAITLRDNTVDIYIPFSEFPTTTHARVPAMVAWIFAKISVSITTYFLYASFATQCRMTQKDTSCGSSITQLPLLSYFNLKEVTVTRAFVYSFFTYCKERGISAITVGEAIRQRIVEMCQKQDISINALCTKSGVKQSTVNNIVSGRNNSTTVSTIQKFCDGFGITIMAFFQSDLFLDLKQEIK